MSEMLGIDQEQIRNWLCKRKIVTATEVLTKPLNISQVSLNPMSPLELFVKSPYLNLISFQAYNSRDALAKAIYSRLFSWIVNELNKSLSSGTKVQKFIGVLDIYGLVLPTILLHFVEKLTLAWLLSGQV